MGCVWYSNEKQEQTLAKGAGKSKLPPAGMHRRQLDVPPSHWGQEQPCSAPMAVAVLWKLVHSVRSPVWGSV